MTDSPFLIYPPCEVTLGDGKHYKLNRTEFRYDFVSQAAPPKREAYRTFEESMPLAEKSWAEYVKKTTRATYSNRPTPDYLRDDTKWEFAKKNPPHVKPKSKINFGALYGMDAKSTIFGEEISPAEAQRILDKFAKAMGRNVRDIERELIEQMFYAGKKKPEGR